MKYEDPKLQNALAAEYVLGTLTGRARRRFERLLRGNPGLVGELRQWEAILGRLGHRLKPVTPRDRVWAEIDYRINAPQAHTTMLANAVQRVNFWRAWAIAASLFCGVVGFELWQSVSAPPVVVEVPRIVKVPQPVPYIAMLEPGGDVKFLLALSPDKGVIKVAVKGTHPPVDYLKRSLELWVLDESGKPHSLGVMPHDGEAQMPMPKGVPMPAKPTLAISDEPRGGSPTGQPTGPVLTAAPAMVGI